MQASSSAATEYPPERGGEDGEDATIIRDDSSVGDDALNNDNDDDINDEHYFDHDDDDDNSDNDDDDDWECMDEMEASLSNRPIVVGYAFGPKKMSTMGVVMAEASKTKLSTTLCSSGTFKRPEERFLKSSSSSGNQQLQYPKNEDFSYITATDCTNDNDVIAVNAPLSTDIESTGGELTQARLQSYQPTFSSCYHQNEEQDNVIFIMDGQQPNNSSSTTSNMRNIVRHFRSSCSSIAEEEDVSTSSSTATRTASTATTTTYTALLSCSSGSYSRTKQRQQPHGGNKNPSTSRRAAMSRQYPIRVSFVPLDPEIPLEEQHGGIDIILHKLTEDILCLSQLSMEHDQLQQKQQQGTSMSSTATSDIRANETTTTTTPLEQLRALGLSSSSSPSNPLLLSGSQQEKLAAIRRVDRLLEFRRSKGRRCLVDDPICVQKLMSRADIAQTLESCLENVTSTSGMPVGAPKYLVVLWPPPPSPPSSTTTDGASSSSSLPSVEWMARSLERANMSFPLIVKPLIAAGTKASHAMAILTQPRALQEYFVSHQQQQQQPRRNCLLQVYCNHDALLHKVYVLGDYVSVHKRRSLPNLPRHGKSVNCFVEFDSQRPYPRFRDFGYTTAITKATPTNEVLPSTTASVAATTSIQDSGGSAENNGATPPPPNMTNNSINVTADEVRPIVDALKKAFGLEIFGFDVLITSEQDVDGTDDDDAKDSGDYKSTLEMKRKQRRRMLVVDVNYFPSYKEVPNFPALLAKYLTDRAIENRRETLLRTSTPIPALTTTTTSTEPRIMSPHETNTITDVVPDAEICGIHSCTDNQSQTARE